MDILHDTVFQFMVNVIVALLAGITAVITSIAIFRAQRNRKEVNYEILSDTPLLSINEEIKGKVEIRFANKLVSDMRLTILRILNSGNVPIAPGDFVEPFSFEFKGGEVLDSEILETEPNNNKAVLKQNVDNVVLEPLLLNSGDSIKIKMLAAGTNNTVGINARIIGVNKITELDVRRSVISGRSVTMALAVLVVISIILTSINYFRTSTIVNTNTVSYNVSDAVTVNKLSSQYYRSILQSSYRQAYNMLSAKQRAEVTLSQFMADSNYTLPRDCLRIGSTSAPVLQADGKTWMTSLLLDRVSCSNNSILVSYSWVLSLQKEQNQFVIVSEGPYPVG